MKKLLRLFLGIVSVLLFLIPVSRFWQFVLEPDYVRRNNAANAFHRDGGRNG